MVAVDGGSDELLDFGLRFQLQRRRRGAALHRLREVGFVDERYA